MTRTLWWLSLDCSLGVSVKAFPEMIRSWGLWPDEWFNPLMDSELNRFWEVVELWKVGLVGGRGLLGQAFEGCSLALAPPHFSSLLPDSHEVSRFPLLCSCMMFVPCHGPESNGVNRPCSEPLKPWSQVNLCSCQVFCLSNSEALLLHSKVKSRWFIRFYFIRWWHPHPAPFFKDVSPIFCNP